MKLVLILLVVAGTYSRPVYIESEGHFRNRYIVKVRTSLLVEIFKVQLRYESEELKKESDGEFGDYKILFALKTDPSVLVMRMDRKVLQKVLVNDAIAYIEEDELNIIKATNDPEKGSTLANEPPLDWGLDRINQVGSALDGDISFNGDGRGVHIYILDSGINETHEDFGGRASRAYDVFNASGDDCLGHGTNVAGIAAGTTRGVAKNATIHSVRTLDCKGGSGTSHMIRAIDWVANHAQLPCVATMAFSKRTISPTICDAVKRLSEAGCLPIAAATNVKRGSTNYEVCERSPPRSPYAITVAATELTSDQRAGFSRYGMCVDIFAPGNDIWSTSSDGGYAWKSGTSMSAAFVAGVAAIHLGNGVPADKVHSRIIKDAIVCQLPDVGAGSPNRFLYVDHA